jgi:hypothetical protein
MFSEWGTRNSLRLPLFVSALLCDLCGCLRPSLVGRLVQRVPESRNEVDAERRYVRSHAERGNENAAGDGGRCKSDGGEKKLQFVARIVSPH